MSDIISLLNHDPIVLRIWGKFLTWVEGYADFASACLSSHTSLPLTELLSVPLMDPTISYLEASRRFFPLQRKNSLSSPFSAFTVNLIVEKERERQVEVNQIKVFYLFLSKYS